MGNHHTDSVDRVCEIERLAALGDFDYELERATAASRLGVRATALDTEVKRTRRALGLDTNSEADGQGRTVKIADVLPWHEPVEGDFIATGISTAAKTYMVLKDTAADAIALWVLHTWLVNEFSISPRLAVTSPTKGCGKTTVLRFLNKVVRRPKRAGSISPSALFRAVEMFQPTVILDETEKYIEHGSDMHALLNEGHCKGGSVLRVLGEKLELREFSLFGAVAFARNGRLPDDLEQRSIIIEMQRRRPDEELAELRDDRADNLDRLARMAARWADDYAGQASEPDMGGLINRTADNWRPLFAIADLIGGDWPERIREAAGAMTSKAADSLSTTLLSDIRDIFDARERAGGEWADRMFSEMLVEALVAIEGGKWAEYGKAQKPLSKNQLAQLLEGFKVRSETVRVGSKTLKGYRRHRFNDAWERYLSLQGVCETSQRNNPDEVGGSTTFRNVTADTLVAFEKCEKPPSNGPCDVVTFEKGGGRTCDHCRRPGTADNPLLQVSDAGREVRLHDGCIAKRPPSDDGIPDFLRRVSGR